MKMTVLWGVTRKDKEKSFELPAIVDLPFSEDWAQTVHGQTLARLNERGGLHPCEMYMNLNKIRRIDGIEIDFAISEIKKLLK